MYGLKNAPLEWYRLFAGTLESEELGFRRLASDSCIFMRTDESFAVDEGSVDSVAKMYLSVYVDDVLMCCNSEALYRDVMDKLGNKFPINENDTGDASWLVGMNITRNRDDGWVMLSQEAAILKLADACGLTDTNPKATPMATDPLPKLQEAEAHKLALTEAAASGGRRKRRRAAVDYASLDAQLK